MPATAAPLASGSVSTTELLPALGITRRQFDRALQSLELRPSIAQRRTVRLLRSRFPGRVRVLALSGRDREVTVRLRVRGAGELAIDRGGAIVALHPEPCVGA